MKNMFTKLTNTLKANKAVFITTVTAVVIAILLTSFTACRSGNEQAPSQDMTTTTESETVTTDSTTATDGEEAATTTTTESETVATNSTKATDREEVTATTTTTKKETTKPKTTTTPKTTKTTEKPKTTKKTTEKTAKVSSGNMTPELKELFAKPDLCQRCGELKDDHHHRYVSDTPCPDCGVTIPARDCHVCGK